MKLFPFVKELPRVNRTKDPVEVQKSKLTQLLSFSAIHTQLLVFGERWGVKVTQNYFFFFYFFTLSNNTVIPCVFLPFLAENYESYLIYVK